MTTPHSSARGLDLVVIASSTCIRLLIANGFGIRLHSSIPLSDRTRTLDLLKALTPALRSLAPRRVLLSMRRDTPYERIAEPVIEALCSFCDLESLPLIWLPDVCELAKLCELPQPNPPNPARPSLIVRRRVPGTTGEGHVAG